MNIALKVIQSAVDAPPPTGPFVVELGDQTAIGVSGREVAEILESQENAHARVFRIHRAYPDGRMELVGVSHDRFHAEDAFLFWRQDGSESQADFDALRAAAALTPPPCRSRVHRVRAGGQGPAYLVALLFPAEYGPDMSAWLSEVKYGGGDSVEGGLSAATSYASMHVDVLEQLQLWGTADGTLVAPAVHQPARAVGA